MTPKFEVSIIVQKPVSEVFDAIYNPQKLSAYFTTGRASAQLKEGTTVLWEFADFPGPFLVPVKQVIQDKLIIIEWESAEGGYNTRTDFVFESLNPKETKVQVSESGWRDTEKGILSSYQNCQGWSQMLCSMKAYLEYGINLRQGAYKALYNNNK